MIRFVEILLLCQLFWGLIWTNFDNFKCQWAYFHSSKWPNVEQKIFPSGHTYDYLRTGLGKNAAKIIVILFILDWRRDRIRRMASHVRNHQSGKSIYLTFCSISFLLFLFLSPANFLSISFLLSLSLSLGLFSKYLLFSKFLFCHSLDLSSFFYLYVPLSPALSLILYLSICLVIILFTPKEVRFST